MGLETIRQRLVALAGGGVNLNPKLRQTKGIGLYSTMTLAGLEDMPAVRNTLERLDTFDVPDDLTGMKVLDIGSNEGSFSFEFARRGADVVAVEFRKDRVELCKEIALHFGVTNIKFLADDFSRPDSFLLRDPYDYVSCLCVSKFIDDSLVEEFYKALREVTKGILLFESNCGRSKLDLETQFYRVGFTELNYLGATSRHRKAFRVS